MLLCDKHQFYKCMSPERQAPLGAPEQKAGRILEGPDPIARARAPALLCSSEKLGEFFLSYAQFGSVAQDIFPAGGIPRVAS